MAIITLTTDFGLKDFYVGALKGSIYKELDSIKIVDISHHIEPFNIQQCSYVLENSYKSFPKGTIHIVGIDSESTIENQHIVALIDGHYFITANTGVIGLLTLDKKPTKIFQIAIPNPNKGPFPVKDVFVKVACHIARGGTLEVIGKPFDALKEIKEFSAMVSDSGNKITGNVIYIDNYGNVVTNIPKHLFESYRNGRDFELHARNNIIKKIHNRYSDIIDFSIDKASRKGPGDLLALFNSSEYIELAIYKSNLDTVGGASTLLGLDYRDTITINFI